MGTAEPKTRLEFPESSGMNTDETFSWAEVKALLDKEFMRRGEYLARLLSAFRSKFGDEAMEVARKVIYQIGYEKGALRAQIAGQRNEKNDLENLAGQVAHRISRLYFGTKPLLSGDKLIIRESYCPLPRKWRDMGYSDDEIVQLCLLSDQVDKGMVEGFNKEMTAELTGCRTLAENGYCQMAVRYTK